MAMKIALVAPSGVPFVVGGAEKLWWGLAQHINRHTPHELELIKLPSPENDFATISASYERWSLLNLDHFDAVISTKYPAWMVSHRNHIVYLQHKLRGLYDTYPASLSLRPTRLPSAAQALWQLIQCSDHSRSQLPEIFGRVKELLSTSALSPQEVAELTALPGPLLRSLVHKLDAIALQPNAIQRYLAISSVVSRRADYFPAGVQVQVLPHPSNLENLRRGPLEYVFTASRLDTPKRLALLITAYRRSRTTVPLRIAGDGPEATHLRALAAGDTRIEFLGRLTDEELVDHYSRAALVPFVPYEEDMGLITLEAMGCGKPVLTVSDAGGVTEFVRDGINGRIVEPTEKALATALDELLADPARLQAMGEAALLSAAEISWQRTAEGLLNAAAAQRSTPTMANDGLINARPRRPGTRMRLLVVNTFCVYPPDNGGKKRLYYLYRGIAQWADVTLLNLGSWGVDASERQLAPHLREICIPPTESFAHAEQTLSKALGNKPVTDIAALLYSAQLAPLREAFCALAPACDVVVAAHVYLAPMVESLWIGPLWYDAFNVEADMKAVVLGEPHPTSDDIRTQTSPLDLRAADLARQCVRHVACAEARLVQRAQRVWAVSTQDRERLSELFGRTVETIELAVNGTHLPTDPWLDAPRRGALKARLGLKERPLAIFVASYHGPNLSAADDVLSLAKQCPDWTFLLVGSVCHHLQARVRPSNLLILGLLEESALRALLRAADVGLNPMRSGSGTNLKMLDYAGHGLLILSTPVGARGLAFNPKAHYWEYEVDEFATALHDLAPHCPAPHHDMRMAARKVAEQVYAWDAIAAGLCNDNHGIGK